MANINHMGGESHLLCPPPPLYTEVGTCRFTYDRSVRSVRVSVPFISVTLSNTFYRAGGQTRDVDPMLSLCWPSVHDAGLLCCAWRHAKCALAPQTVGQHYHSHGLKHHASTDSMSVLPA